MEAMLTMAPPAAGDHEGNDGASQQQRPRHVHVQEAAPIGQVRFEQRAHRGGGRVVDQDIDGNVRPGQAVDQDVDGIGVADVGGRDDGGSTERFDFAGHAIEVAFATGGEDDIRAGMGEREGDGLADAPRGPGDECGLSG